MSSLFSRLFGVLRRGRGADAPADAPMNCHEVGQVLQHYLDGELDPARSARTDSTALPSGKNCDHACDALWAWPGHADLRAVDGNVVTSSGAVGVD